MDKEKPIIAIGLILGISVISTAMFLGAFYLAMALFF